MTRFATVHRFPAPAWSGPLRRPLSRAAIDAAVVRGRRLQAEAMQSGFRRAAAFLIGTVLMGGCLRGLRVQAGGPAKGQPCGCG